MPEQQQQGNLEGQIRALRKKLRAAKNDLRAMYEQYKGDPDLQVELSFLEYWFPKRIETFEKWENRLSQAMENQEYRRSDRFYSALQAYDSLGRALDADTRWSEHDKPFHIKVGEMIDLSEQIRSQLRDEQKA